MKTYQFLLMLGVVSLLPVSGALAQGTGNAPRVPQASPYDERNPFDHARRQRRTYLSREEAEKIFGPSRLRVEQARTLFQARRYTEAEATCKQALAAAPKFNGQPFSPEARRLLGEIYLAQGRYPEASACFSLVRQNTSDVRLDLGLALAYCRAGKLDLARQCFSEKRFLSRTDISPLDLPGTRDQRSMEASILFARGLEAFETGQHDEAIQEFTAAERLAPTNGMIAYFHAYSLRFRNRGEEANPFLAIAATYAHGKAAKKSQHLLRGVSQAKRDELVRWAASLKKQPKAR